MLNRPSKTKANLGQHPSCWQALSARIVHCARDFRTFVMWVTMPRETNMSWQHWWESLQTSWRFYEPCWVVLAFRFAAYSHCVTQSGYRVRHRHIGSGGSLRVTGVAMLEASYKTRFCKTKKPSKMLENTNDESTKNSVVCMKKKQNEKTCHALCVGAFVIRRGAWQNWSVFDSNELGDTLVMLMFAKQKNADARNIGDETWLAFRLAKTPQWTKHFLHMFCGTGHASCVEPSSCARGTNRKKGWSSTWSVRPPQVEKARASGPRTSGPSTRTTPVVHLLMCTTIFRKDFESAGDASLLRLRPANLTWSPCSISSTSGQWASNQYKQE